MEGQRWSTIHGWMCLESHICDQVRGDLGDAMAGQEVLAPFVLCFQVKPFTHPIGLDSGLVAEDSECNLMEGPWATLNGGGWGGHEGRLTRARTLLLSRCKVSAI